MQVIQLGWKWKAFHPNLLQLSLELMLKFVDGGKIDISSAICGGDPRN